MDRKQVVIIGGGFGGLACIRKLRRASVDVTLIDRRNFHLFQPLLYQVATGGLSPANIAAPLRCIVRNQKNARVLLGEVVDFDLANRTIRLNDGVDVPFDYLVVATGSTHHYFGKEDQWESFAPGLKTIEDATLIRRRVLSAFEQAELTTDLDLRKRYLTFMIIGGGPTGIELAGSICELAHQTMRREFRSIDPASARIILVENSPMILDRYHPSLSKKGKEALISLGAEVWNETRLTALGDGYAVVSRLGKEEKVEVATVLWAAGVKGSPLGAVLAKSAGQIEIDRGGRVHVDEHCNIPGFENVFVIGDLAHCKDGKGNPLPGVAPVAVQQGEYLGHRIAKLAAGEPLDKPFRYWDKGNMATIGRSRAVMESGRIRASGRIAWIAWLVIHILYLARFENRVMVLFQWGWNYVTRNRTARLITGKEHLLIDRSAERQSKS